MHCDLDAFFVSVEVALDPNLKGKPVVVGGRAEARGVVASASYEARAFGLKAGMPLVTAKRLCSQAIFVEGNFPRYREASKRFMAILSDFSPFLEPAGLDEAYLDATGFESIHGSVYEMAVSIRKRVRSELGLPLSIGIASCKVVAKVASDESKPDGLIEIADGEEAAYLSPLPVGKLPGVGKKTEGVLIDLGVRTIGELAAMPEAVLKSHFGTLGPHLKYFASGIDPRKIEPPGEARSISRETTFAQDSRDNIFLSAALSYLCEKVGAELRTQSKEARCVTLKLRYADFTTITRHHTLKQATDADQNIFETGRGLLKSALTAEKQPVRLIGIGVSGLAPKAGQLNMLDDKAMRLDKLNRAIDRIRSKYGFEAIKTGRTLGQEDALL